MPPQTPRSTGAGKWLALAACLFLTACGDGTSVQSPNQDIPVVQPDSSGAKSLADFEAHVAARTPADTTLCDHQKLLAVLPDSIAGYKLEFNESNRFASSLFSFTEANKVFYNADQDYIDITLGDYLANPDFFRVNIQRHNLAQGVAISGVKDEKRTVPGLRPAQAKDFFTWSSHNGRKQLAWVFMGIDERYFLTIEATGCQDFLDLNAVKGWLDWSKLQ